jgi:hypothetical protein
MLQWAYVSYILHVCQAPCCLKHDVYQFYEDWWHIIVGGISIIQSLMEFFTPTLYVHIVVIASNTKVLK